jgi:hypothetical protein
MKIVGEFDYRNAKAILRAVAPESLDDIYSVLNDPENQIDLRAGTKQRSLSSQVKQWFVKRGWKAEQPSFAAAGMQYDLLKENIPIEIELGHQRLVFPDFFEFLADYSKEHIPAGVVIVTGTPSLFGHDWHCSLESTTRKITVVREVYLAPTLVVAVNPN